MQVTGISLLVLLLSITTAFPQELPISTRGSLSEKIYLQPDRTVYTTQETIWFKAIVTDAVYHAPTMLSGVLYVELIGPESQLMERKLVYIQAGTGEGFFDIMQDYPQGPYLLRAYTEWNRNFESDCIFREHILIFPSISKNQTTGLDQTAATDQNTKRDQPAESGKPSNAGQSTGPTLRLFPESGEMLHGILNKIAFKALSSAGKGVSVKGEIVDQTGRIVTTFSSSHLGMGSFYIQPDSNNSYFARITSPGKIKPSEKYPLPEVMPKGYILSASKSGNRILLTAISNFRKSDSIVIHAASRGINYFLIKGQLKNGRLNSSLPLTKLPEGIIAFTLVNSTGLPVAERLYFHEKPGGRLKIDLSTDKTSYQSREKTILDIQVTSDQSTNKDTTKRGSSISGISLSLLAINKDQLGELQVLRKNILSWFLLGSELRGEIEDPGYYFNKENKTRLQDLDNLLLTQGWRKYLYRDSLGGTFPFQPEPTLSISGTVSSVFSRKKKKDGVGVTMMTFGPVSAVRFHKTDSLGRFYFDLGEKYGKRLNLLLQTSAPSGKKRDYIITLDKNKPLPISIDIPSPKTRTDTIVQTIVEGSIARQSAEAAYRLSSGTTLLEQVTVEDSRMTPERKKVIETYGEPDAIISGDSIQAKEEKWSYGLYSVLLFNYPREVRITRGVGPGGYLRASVIGGETTLVVIDGIPVLMYNYHLIPSIPPSEVKSVEIIKFAKNFSRLYMEAVPNANPMEIPATGSVIAIYTYGRRGIFGVQKPRGILKASVPVFSTPREFYTPAYESPTDQSFNPKNKGMPDLRALLHWQPLLTTDSTGHASASFYNADIPGDMLIVVEAISPTGKIGYKELTYRVEQAWFAPPPSHPSRTEHAE